MAPSGLTLPWNANYTRTKLPVQSSGAKNRTLSTSQSSSLALASSVPPPPQTVKSTSPILETYDTPSCKLKSASRGVRCDSVLNNEDQHQIQSKMSAIHVTTTPTHIPTASVVMSVSSPKIVSSVATSTNACKDSNLTPTGSSSSTEFIIRRRRSISEGCASTCETNCYEPNSVLVSVEQRREASLSPPKSICCYTIANNSCKTFPKQSIRLNQNRTPRAILSQNTISQNSVTGVSLTNIYNNYSKNYSSNNSDNNQNQYQYLAQNQSHHQYRQQPNHHQETFSNSYIAQDHSIDSLDFRKRIQKFEPHNRTNDHHFKRELLNSFSGSYQTSSSTTAERAISSTTTERSGSDYSTRSLVVDANDYQDHQAILTPRKCDVFDSCYIIIPNSREDSSTSITNNNKSINNNNNCNSIVSPKNDNESISKQELRSNYAKNENAILTRDEKQVTSEFKTLGESAFKSVVIRKLTPKLTRGNFQIKSKPPTYSSNNLGKNDRIHQDDFDCIQVSRFDASSSVSLSQQVKLLPLKTEQLSSDIKYKDDNDNVDNNSDIGYIDASADADNLCFVTGGTDANASDAASIQKHEQYQGTDKISINVNYCFLDTNETHLTDKKCKNLYSVPTSTNLPRKSSEYNDSDDNYYSECDNDRSVQKKIIQVNNIIDPANQVNTKVNVNLPDCQSEGRDLVNRSDLFSPSLSSSSLHSSSALHPAQVTPGITRSPHNIIRRITPASGNPATSDKVLSMERRRLNLDRWQRLGFGRKSSSNSAKQDEKSIGRKGTEKSERLKELTELLKGNRSSPTPPPVPPPRRPRQPSNTEKSSITDLNSTPRSASDDIISMDADEESLPEPINRKSDDISHRTNDRGSISISGTPLSRHNGSLYEALRPNTSISNLEQIIMNRDFRDQINPTTVPLKEEELFTKIPRAESRTIVGSYTQKTIPFRSASFSQVDYSSGKYIKSALSAIRDKLRSDKEPSVVDKAHLTLPRKKPDFRSSSPRLHNKGVDSENNIQSNKLKKSELTVNLNYDAENERLSLEEIVNPPDVILEEEIPFLEAEKTEDTETDNAKDELVENILLVETANEENYDKNKENEDQAKQTVLSGIILDSHLLDNVSGTDDSKQSAQEVLNEIKENICDQEKLDEQITDSLSAQFKEQEHFEPIPKSSGESLEPVLAMLTEEEISMESPPENFLQTATTCLIPVPVYECVAREWDSNDPKDLWLDMAQDEIGLTPAAIDAMTNPFEVEISSKETKNEYVDPSASFMKASSDKCNDVLQLINESVPTISVSPDSFELNEPKKNPEQEIEQQLQQHFEEQPQLEQHSEKQTDPRFGQLLPEQHVSSEEKLCKEKPVKFVEVKKRYSNDDMKIGDKSSLNESQAARGHNYEEKRRIDKSRRRKGMYIQWPTIDKHGEIDANDWSGEPENRGSDGSQDNGSNLNLNKVNFSSIKASIDNESIDPDSLFLNCKTVDDNRLPATQYSFDPTTPESDTNLPVWPKYSRRTSLICQSSEEKDDIPSTASPGERTQRNFVFIRSDSTSDNESDKVLLNRNRKSLSPAPGEQDLKRYSKRPLRGPYGQMLEAEMKKPGKVHYDEILEELKSAESLNTLSLPSRSRGAGNHSFDESHIHHHHHHHHNPKSCRPRKCGGHLPVPVHTRAASTPSQIENTTTTASLNTINPHHKRYQSNLDNTSLETVHSHRLKDPKKISLDSHHDRSEKRSSAEFVENKQHAKRSSSTASEKQQKRGLDEMRLTQSSRTPSERSIAVSGGYTESDTSNLIPTPELLAELLKGSSERLVSEQRQQMFADTRTHVVQEIFRNEQSYVESLQTVVVKYLNVLKTPEYAGMIDSKSVDEIFFMVPEILSIHEKFLNELRMRLDSWDLQQKVGDAFIETFSKAEVLETYTSFVNNCNKAKNTIRMMIQTRPSFARFLEAMSREHKGKLALDNLLIKPVQKFPNYEMLFTRLIKHTDIGHPDQKPLQEVLKLVHEILVHINCKEKELLENGQREATLRELEGVIEGITELVTSDRQFLLFDLISMPSGQGARKERGFFLFSDLLVITSIKRRSGTIRKPNTSICPGSVAATLDTNKYKFLTKISLDNLDIVKSKDENLRKIMNEIEQLADDCTKLQQIAEIAANLRYPHIALEEAIRDLQREVQRQLCERQSNDTQLSMLELTVNSPNGMQNLSIVFCKPEKRSQWEEAFNEAKQKLVASIERYHVPEFLSSIPIRKTRAGLQFTCAAPTISNQKDVWVCNSDGYVGQVCVLSLIPEPTVTSCNGVCNARILCVASVPANSALNNHSTINSSNDETPRSSRNSDSSTCQTPTNINEHKKTTNKVDNGRSDIQLDSNSSSDDSEGETGNLERAHSPTLLTSVQHHHQDSNSDDPESHQSTMWLGTEDGCIHVYNCTDNIRIKKNKIKIQHVSAVYSILYLDNRVFVSLANGDICVYLRDNGGWNTTSPHCLSIGSVTGPVSRLLNVHGKLWCSIQGIIKVLDTKSLQVENQIQISSDSKPITNMAVSNNYVWMSIQNSAHIKCFHSNSYELIFEVNLAPSVNKMLSNCDDIIRQHKAACLRVTSLLACKELIWIGTSAGVLLTIPAQGYNIKGQTNNLPVVTGIPHGHTGHVRFLTHVEREHNGNGSVGTDGNNISISSTTKTNRYSAQTKPKSEIGSVLIISGGDGYEDFRSSGANTMSEVAGREDSTNHLLLWQM